MNCRNNFGKYTQLFLNPQPDGLFMPSGVGRKWRIQNLGFKIHNWAGALQWLVNLRIAPITPMLLIATLLDYSNYNGVTRVIIVI